MLYRRLEFRRLPEVPMITCPHRCAVHVDEDAASSVMNGRALRRPKLATSPVPASPERIPHGAESRSACGLDDSFSDGGGAHACPGQMHQRSLGPFW